MKNIIKNLIFSTMMLFLTIPSYAAAQRGLTMIPRFPSGQEVKGVEVGNISQLKNKSGLIDGMVFIIGGCFEMGDTFGDGNKNEKPVHEVCVDDFYLGEHEVTQGEWKKIMGSNPSHFKDCGDDCPVEQVSWNDAREYIRKLNAQTGERYRLPTEAEWEYAAREGGRKIKWAGTSNESELVDYAWYATNLRTKSHPVKTKKPNALGLYDMSGNVWEWVSDWYGEKYYNNSPRNNPKGAISGKSKVQRGGSWLSLPEELRATIRYSSRPDLRFGGDGFRIAQD